jgi:hypothetical protein
MARGRSGCALPALEPEIVDKILDVAEMFNVLTVEVSTHVEGCNLNFLYAQISLPGTARFAHSITVDVISKDQGWSSYPASQGTREGSWTWGELGRLPDCQVAGDLHLH